MERERLKYRTTFKTKQKKKSLKGHQVDEMQERNKKQGFYAFLICKDRCELEIGYFIRNLESNHIPPPGILSLLSFFFLNLFYIYPTYSFHRSS